MHSTPTHFSAARVSRRGYREAQIARQLSAVAPCLHTTVTRDEAVR
jgi:hypothetical protein